MQEDGEGCQRSCLYQVSAFLLQEHLQVSITYTRGLGGESITSVNSLQLGAPGNKLGLGGGGGEAEDNTANSVFTCSHFNNVATCTSGQH